MKSFKAAAFFLEKNGTPIRVPIQSGLVINKEDEHQSWLIELFLLPDSTKITDEIMTGSEYPARVAITHEQNDPALFLVKPRSFFTLDSGISILLDARLQTVRNDYAKQLLESLIEQGLGGSELLSVFARAITERPALPISKKEAPFQQRSPSTLESDGR